MPKFRGYEHVGINDDRLVGTFKELSARTHQTDVYGDHFTKLVRIQAPKGVSTDVIKNVINDRYEYHCGCVHDCCGHIQATAYTHTLKPAKGKAPSKREFVFEVSLYRNI